MGCVCGTPAADKAELQQVKDIFNALIAAPPIDLDQCQTRVEWLQVHKVTVLQLNTTDFVDIQWNCSHRMELYSQKLSQMIWQLYLLVNRTLEFDTPLRHDAALIPLVLEYAFDADALREYTQGIRERTYKDYLLAKSIMEDDTPLHDTLIPIVLEYVFAAYQLRTYGITKAVVANPPEMILPGSVDDT